MKLRIAPATKRSEILRCQYFIAEVYNRVYSIFFSEDIYDLDARIEPYPHRYIMGTVDGELVACQGLYTHLTYVERFGDVHDHEIQKLVDEAGVQDRYDAVRKHETTKLVVRRGWTGYGIGKMFHLWTHTREFLQEGTDPDKPALVVVCATMSIFNALFGPGRIHSRRLKPFPYYEVHSEYRSEDNPMESRLIIPELDIPKHVYEAKFPIELPLPEKRTSKK